MKKLIILPLLVGIMGLIIVLFLVVLMGEPEVPMKPEVEMRTDILVVIDPGHGGIDSGTHDGHGLLEKDITLDIGLRMRDFLQKQGVPVVMTREVDDDVTDVKGRGRHRSDLTSRARIINQGTVAVSIHVNYSGNSQEQGALVFYERDNLQAEELGEKMVQVLAPIQNLNYDCPIPRKNLYLLNNTRVPMVLVEVGFISNAKDKQKLQDPVFLQTLAEELAKALITPL